MQAVHDGVNVVFLLQVDGAFAYTKGYFRLLSVLLLHLYQCGYIAIVEVVVLFMATLLVRRRWTTNQLLLYCFDAQIHHDLFVF